MEENKMGSGTMMLCPRHSINMENASQDFATNFQKGGVLYQKGGKGMCSASECGCCAILEWRGFSARSADAEGGCCIRGPGGRHTRIDFD